MGGSSFNLRHTVRTLTFPFFLNLKSTDTIFKEKTYKLRSNILKASYWENYVWDISMLHGVPLIISNLGLYKVLHFYSHKRLHFILERSRKINFAPAYLNR